MPRFSRFKSHLFRINKKSLRLYEIFFLLEDSVIKNLITSIAIIDKTPIKIKIPDTPINSLIKGLSTSDKAKVKPMDTPTIPIAFVRL